MAPTEDRGLRGGWLPLKPREHGAYAMVTFPLLSGLVLGGWSVAGGAFVLVAVAAFLAYEPVTVLTGGRGARVMDASGGRARRSLVPLTLAVVVGGLVFLAAAPAWGRAAVALPGLLGAGVLALSLAGRVKSVPGELLVAAAFASTHLPVAAAGGASGGALWIPPLVWFSGFSLATLTVHSLKVRFKGKGPGGWTVPAAPVLAAAVVLTGVGVPLAEPRLVAMAALVPVALVPLGLSLVLVHPRNLRRIGWTLVGVDTLTFVLLAVLVGG